MRIKRIYHHYDKWECFKNGFYNQNKETKESVELDYLLLIDIIELRSSMLMVIDSWPNSSDQFLSNYSLNRIAWLGQAACCIKNKSSENITRKAWKMLTEEQMNNANKVAIEVINEFENRKMD